MANGFNVVIAIVSMLRAYSVCKWVSYDWNENDDVYFIVRRYNDGREYSKKTIFKIKRAKLDELTPNDIMLIYKKLHREEFTCDTIAGRG